MQIVHCSMNIKHLSIYVDCMICEANETVQINIKAPWQKILDVGCLKYNFLCFVSSRHPLPFTMKDLHRTKPVYKRGEADLHNWNSKNTNELEFDNKSACCCKQATIEVEFQRFWIDYYSIEYATFLFHIRNSHSHDNIMTD